MKKIFKLSLTAVALAVIAGSASAQTTGIKSTPHNLTAATGTGPNRQSSTEQICVFCHTPHAANTSASAPLWNKAVPPSTGYTTYSTANSSTIDGQVLSVGSVSAACLSCHDGTQAMDNLVNAPGSGGLVAAGSNRPYTWTVGAETISATSVANLSKDLTNDHPIGIQYCGGGLSGSAAVVSGNCKDGDFVRPVTQNINNTQVFWVDTTNAGSRTKNDIILYTRTFSAGAGPSVECASCHDPHVPSKGSDNIAFMRVTTSGSQICLSCHTK
ncbi:hypothetical protein GPA22_13130 [Aromatoleum toluvorans]|uniref:Doubled CXXCH motif domain-containing protein n=1 Tax=Aromatoleum toluvorans TaxID=92002 RepID=A0ABX1PZN1_9RHOO|nr:cytochrome c3 family protein [Aromatoleum toluvorans]NMG44665.1 hypothetical protein [Aromatoleum toluvorans]